MKTHPICQRHATWLTGVLALMAADGCSFLYDFGTQQCNTTDDCRKMGLQFANSVCQKQVCVAQAAQGGATGTGGRGGTTGEGGSNATGGTTAVGGTTSAGGTTEFGGASGVGGTPGSGGQPACSNAQCATDHDSTWICRNNACVQLTSADCPVLIPQKTYSELLQKPGAILVGGYATMANTSSYYDSQAISNWDLVFDDFNQATLGGLQPYAGSGQRPFVGVICRGDGATTDTISRSMQHLTEVAQTAAILSTLSPNNLYQAWQYVNPDVSSATAPTKPVFFMNTGSADLRLANLPSNGLMWHMLGNPRTLAAPIVALLKQIEPYVYAQRKANFATTQVDDPDSVPMRVTLIKSDEPIMLDVANVLTSPVNPNYPGTLLAFNGKSPLDNATNFRMATIYSARQHNSADVTTGMIDGISDLLNYPPHVVVAMATSEFPSVLNAVENSWSQKAPGQIRPYYLMSHFIYNTNQLLLSAQTFFGMKPPLEARVVGVNYAAAQEQRAKDLYSSYLIRLKSHAAGVTVPLDGTENNYDGAYYLLYSLTAAAANLSSPDGRDIKDGLKTRIISDVASAVPVDVGYGPLSGDGTSYGTISRLFSDKIGYKISLYGTMGPPDFDLLSGTRVSAISAWCVQKATTASTWTYMPDGLLFNTGDQTYSPAAAGIPACLQNYCTSSTGAPATCPQSY